MTLTALREWLKQRGMTQRQLAQELGLSEVYIYQIISGVKPMTPGFRGRFADCYGYAAAGEVFGDESNCEGVQQ